MSAKILKLIPKLVEKKGGIKLADVVTYLKGRDDAEELGDLSFASIKRLVIDLFSEKKVDLVEYKCPGEDPKQKMFLIPVGTVVTYEDETPEYVLPEPVMEVKTLLPADLFDGYLIIPNGDGGAAHTQDAYEAFGLWTQMAANGQKPRLFGAVPINLEMKALLDTVEDMPVVEALEHTTAHLPAEFQEQEEVQEPVHTPVLTLVGTDTPAEPEEQASAAQLSAQVANVVAATIGSPTPAPAQAKAPVAAKAAPATQAKAPAVAPKRIVPKAPTPKVPDALV